MMSIRQQGTNSKLRHQKFLIPHPHITLTWDRRNLEIFSRTDKTVVWSTRLMKGTDTTFQNSKHTSTQAIAQEIQIVTVSFCTSCVYKNKNSSWPVRVFSRMRKVELTTKVSAYALINKSQELQIGGIIYMRMHKCIYISHKVHSCMTHIINISVSSSFGNGMC